MRSVKRIFIHKRKIRTRLRSLLQALAFVLLMPCVVVRGDDFAKSDSTRFPTVAAEQTVQDHSQSNSQSQGADSAAQSTSVAAAAIQPQIIPDVERFQHTSQSFPTASPESGFWFLNTHQSPQTFNACGPVFRPGISRYEQGEGYRTSSYSEMLSRLEPGVPICIMAHGSFVDTLSASRESCYTYHWIRSVAGNQRMQMIYFHWPSYRAISPLIQLDTNQLGRQAARNGFYLAELISSLPPECPVAILGHSHGSRVASSALHLLAGGNVQGYYHRRAGTNLRPIRTVFLAGAIDHHWLNPGEKYDRALSSTQGILNLKNCSDPALAIYPFRLPLLTRRPIGNIGMTNRDRRRTGLPSQKVYDFEVSDLIGPSHLWPYYFNSKQIALTMRNYIYFPDLVASNQPSMNQAKANKQHQNHALTIRTQRTVQDSHQIESSVAAHRISAKPDSMNYISQTNVPTSTR